MPGLRIESLKTKTKWLADTDNISAHSIMKHWITINNSDNIDVIS